MIKDYEGCLRAMEAMEDAYQAVLASAHTGMLAKEVDAILCERLQAHGAQLLPSHISPFLVGEEGVPPKLRVNRVPLERGRLWGIDNKVRLAGYYADIGRYGYIGSLPPALSAEHQRVLEQQKVIAAAVRPDRTVEEIYRACPRGLPFEVHRIGMEPFMLPVCGDATPTVLEAMERSQLEGLLFQLGMVICVELWAGLRGGIEDMYVMEPEGLMRITTLPRTIFAIPESSA